MNQALACKPDISRPPWVPMAALGVPVVPPLKSMIAGSWGLMATSGREAPACRRNRSASHWSPGWSVMRSPSAFSLARVYSRRSSGGKYSLRLVARMQWREVLGWTDLTLS